MNIKICKLHENAKTPTYATDGSGCFDLYAATVQDDECGDEFIDHGFPRTCGTGLGFEIPHGHVMLVFSRSGHGFKNGVRLSNCVGVIDADFRGEVMVQLTQDLRGYPDESEVTAVHPGERIAQALVLPIPKVQFEVVEQLSLTDRGDGGFGSSGV